MKSFKRTAVGAAVVVIGSTGLTAPGLAQAAVNYRAACSHQHNHVRVMAVDNIWGAALKTPPDPGGGGGGELPQRIAVPSGALAMTMRNVAGQVAWVSNEKASNGADGDTRGDVGSWRINAVGGISGISDSTSFFYLVGVFLGKKQPGKPPAGVDYTGRRSSASFKPRLGQVFFIGDGLTGDGKTQQFRIPAGTRNVYLGFADAFAANGPPGWYSDNIESLFGTVGYTCK